MPRGRKFVALDLQLSTDIYDIPDSGSAQTRSRSTYSPSQKRRWRRRLCKLRQESQLASSGSSQGSFRGFRHSFQPDFRGSFGRGYTSKFRGGYTSRFRGGFGRGSTLELRGDLGHGSSTRYRIVPISEVIGDSVDDFNSDSVSESESSPLTPRARTPSQSVSDQPQSSELPQKTPSISGPLLDAIERFWDLEKSPDNPQNTGIGGDTSPISPAPNPSDLGQVAGHASLMLEVFSHVKPVDDRQVTTVQRGLVTTALTSVLAITQQLRALTVSANEQLEPLPAAHDEALKIYSGCIVCFTRVADMLLMPCRHLMLCEVCCDKIDENQAGAQNGAQTKLMRCPVCRKDVLDRCRSRYTVADRST